MPARELMDYYQQHLEGQVVENAFISSHLRKGRWSDKETGVQLIINTCFNSKGKDLRGLSFNVDEQEVLFRKGSKFFVEKISLNPNIVSLKDIQI